MTIKVKGEVFCVVGLGQSGLAAARMLRARGAEVRAYDARSREELGLAALELFELDIALVTGELDEAAFRGVTQVVISPGVPPKRVRELAQAAGATVTGELELASRLVSGPIVAIAGTNGKSTVTRMLGDILERGARPVFVGGNLGAPLSEVVDTAAAGPDGVLSVEVSSFQLETVELFRAHIALLLNITDDHLDRYEDFADYAAAKGRVFAAQTVDDYALVPADDALIAGLAEAGPGHIEYFGGEHGLVRIEHEMLVSRDGSLAMPVSELGVSGAHNLVNACAAASAALLLGVVPAEIVEALRNFKGLPHRMQTVVDFGGVRFVDDSKATNVGAAVAALEGFGSGPGRVVWVAGGRDKGGSYEPLLEPITRVGRAIVCIGEAGPKIARALRPTGVRIERAATMEEAVRLSSRLASEGDTVLLAPACSSYDMFKTYAHRGDAFAGAARALSLANEEED